jgi:transcriptional regulator with XRE-family HTH domain
MDVAERFADNVYKARKRAGLTQEDLGFVAGLHRTEVGLLERGSRVPRIDTLVKVASGLGVKPECLLEGIAWETAKTTPGGFDIASARSGHEGDA